jgi:hypothetical protein
MMSGSLAFPIAMNSASASRNTMSNGATRTKLAVLAVQATAPASRAGAPTSRA